MDEAPWPGVALREQTSILLRLVVLAEAALEIVRLADIQFPHPSLYDFRFVGDTARGTPPWFNKRALAVDRIISTGGVMFHVFAGLGGGGKACYPASPTLDETLARVCRDMGPEAKGCVVPRGSYAGPVEA